jgi:tRNA(fMet)-specific endonuclease VapC
MYLLNTDILIYSLKGNPTVMDHLRRHQFDLLKVCVITLMELYFGAFKSQRPTGNIARVRAIESAFDVLPLGVETAQTFGMLKAGLQKSGTPLHDFDLLLASCALAHNLVLVSNNIRHFSRIEGLRIENWAEVV